MKTLAHAKRIIVKEMVENGTMARLDSRIEKHNSVAKSLGFVSAQAAFNSMGKSFLTLANA